MHCHDDECIFWKGERSFFVKHFTPRYSEKLVKKPLLLLLVSLFGRLDAHRCCIGGKFGFAGLFFFTIKLHSCGFFNGNICAAVQPRKYPINQSGGSSTMQRVMRIQSRSFTWYSLRTSERGNVNSVTLTAVLFVGIGWAGLSNSQTADILRFSHTRVCEERSET